MNVVGTVPVNAVFSAQCQPLLKLRDELEPAEVDWWGRLVTETFILHGYVVILCPKNRYTIGTWTGCGKYIVDAALL